MHAVSTRIYRAPLFLFCSHRFIEAEACALMAEGETSHGFCDQKEWPPPFQSIDYLGQRGFSFYYHDDLF